MKVIRRGVFETNSSSTHSITMCSKEDYDKWESGDVYLNDGSGWASLSTNKDKQFVTKEEAIEILTNSKYPPEKDLTTLNDEELEEYYNCVGGDFLFPDLKSVISGNKTYTTKLTQLFILGSVVGNSFGIDGSADYIENFFVTAPSAGDLGGTTNKIFSLVGLRAW